MLSNVSGDDGMGIELVPQVSDKMLRVHYTIQWWVGQSAFLPNNGDTVDPFRSGLMADKWNKTPQHFTNIGYNGEMSLFYLIYF